MYIGETSGQYGVGFLIKKELTARIIEIKGVTERITILNTTLSLNKEEKFFKLIRHRNQVTHMI